MGSNRIRLVLAVSALLAVGCTPSASVGSAKPVGMSLCGGALAAHPAQVDVICANNSITARNLRWSAWGGPVATATGSAVVDLCAYQDCAQGDYVTAPIVLIASKVMPCASQEHAYARLQYTFVGRSPFAGLNAKIAVADGSTTPNGGLGDQTVSLTC